jgi:hypothetical protein
MLCAYPIDVHAFWGSGFFLCVCVVFAYVEIFISFSALCFRAKKSDVALLLLFITFFFFFFSTFSSMRLKSLELFARFGCR